MYINFKFLTSSGLDIHQFITLLAINQGEDLFHEKRESIVNHLVNNDYIEKQKNGRYKLTVKGRGYVDAIEKPESSKDIEILALELYSLYKEKDKTTGNRLEAQDNLAWFCANTNFSEEAIRETTKYYLDNSGDYTMSLSNFIWRAPNVFSAHKNLKNSRLFEEIVKLYNLTPTYYMLGKQSVLDDWLFAISRLKNPPKSDEDIYITGSRDGDIEAIRRVKKILFERMKGL